MLSNVRDPPYFIFHSTWKSWKTEQHFWRQRRLSLIVVLPIFDPFEFRRMLCGNLSSFRKGLLSSTSTLIIILKKHFSNWRKQTICVSTRPEQDGKGTKTKNLLLSPSHRFKVKRKKRKGKSIIARQNRMAGICYRKAAIIGSIHHTV